MRARSLSLMLLAALLATFLLSTPPPTHANVGQASTGPTMSAVNEVPDFYAEGSSGGYYLKITPQGGSLTTSTTKMPLMPWGYVTAHWTIGTVYIIFLANVTETDFYVAFLYLTNSSTSNFFLLRMLEYQDANTLVLTFQGTQRLNARTVATSSIIMPQMRLEAKPQTTKNLLSAIGPELYLNSNRGQVFNGTQRLAVFPLLDQYFQGTDEYNELWSLLADNAGDYYFAILYMQNSDPNHVIMEHIVRLNDYKTIGGRTFDARWSRGFVNSLTVTLPTSNVTVKVDGFPFQTSKDGVASVSLPYGPVTIEAPDEIVTTGNAKLHFTSWNKFGAANPLKLVLNSTLQLTANYLSEYPLTIDSQYGNTQGSGWYPQGTNASFTVSPQITLDNGTRRVFVRWEGDYSSTSYGGSLVMSSPRHVIAIWKTQFQIKLHLAGVPENSTGEVTVNGQRLDVNGSSGSEYWADSNTQVAIQVQSTVIQGTTANYNFTELRVDDQASSSNIIVTKPITLSIVYSERSKAQSSIDLNVNPSVQGYPVLISGSVPSGVPSTVSLFYSSDNANWQTLGSVAAGADGRFSYEWKTNSPGTYFIKAYWPGDAQRAAASQTATVRILEPPFSNIGSGYFSDIIGGYVSKARGIPGLSLLIDLANALLILGVVLGTSIVPGSAVFGQFIGSLLLGFVFIFPISALILTAKAAVTHRSPSFIWLTPLMTIWVAALALIAAHGLFILSQPLLLQASEVLLIGSNVLLLPLVLSVTVARAIVS